VRKYLSFYSAGTYFQHQVCPELDLPSVDINQTLSAIETKISNGEYTSQYDINSDLFHLFGAVKDGHVQFIPTCVAGAFYFFHDHPLVQLSSSPDSIPETYIVDLNLMSDNPSPKLGEKVVKINGIDPTEYLENMARSHPEGSWIDPDARFNQLLLRQSGGKWIPGNFAARGLYEENPIQLTLATGKTVDISWKALYRGHHFVPDTQSFYETQCIRSDVEISAEITSHQKTKRDLAVAAVGLGKRQRMLDALKDGTLGYYLLTDDTAVLEISAFESADGSSPDTVEAYASAFSRFIARFTAFCRSHGVRRLVIDVSSNGGGLLDLGHNLARQLFPTSDRIFFGSNMRWNPVLAAWMSSPLITSSYFDLGDLRKPDGSEWSGFEELLGPVHRDDDYFTHISIPDEAESNAEWRGAMYTDYSQDQPFAAEDIVIVSPGTCGSTCAVFAEVMQALGVRMVAVGGRPRKGPMQGVGGIKGSQVLTFDEIAMFTQLFLGADEMMQEKPYPMRLRTEWASINFRNSWRKDGQFLPIEFLYTAAEKRVFYTQEMVTNPQALHKVVADVMWGGAKDVGGGPYTPEMGADGSGFVWPDGADGVSGGGKTSGGKKGGKKWDTVGGLIWGVMRGEL
jgi:hypothetical protein